MFVFMTDLPYLCGSFHPFKHMSSFFSSVEFYVIAAVAAAAVVGLCVRPSHKGEARKYLLGSTLTADGGDDDTPRIDAEVSDDGTVILRRSGLRGLLRPSGAVSAAVTVAGFDIVVEERLTPGRDAGDTPDAPIPTDAVFALDFLGREHYHLRYYSEATGGMAAMPLHVRPGIRIGRPLL